MAGSQQDNSIFHVSQALQLAVRATRIAHESRDVDARERFAFGFSACLIHSEELLIDAGMPDLLLDILLEDDTYQFIDPPRLGEVDEFVNVNAIVCRASANHPGRN